MKNKTATTTAKGIDKMVFIHDPRHFDKSFWWCWCGNQTKTHSWEEVQVYCNSKDQDLIIIGRLKIILAVTEFTLVYQRMNFLGKIRPFISCILVLLLRIIITFLLRVCEGPAKPFLMNFSLLWLRGLLVWFLHCGVDTSLLGGNFINLSRVRSTLVFSVSSTIVDFINLSRARSSLVFSVDFWGNWLIAFINLSRASLVFSVSSSPEGIESGFFSTGRIFSSFLSPLTFSPPFFSSVFVTFVSPSITICITRLQKKITQCTFIALNKFNQTRYLTSSFLSCWFAWLCLFFLQDLRNLCRVDCSMPKVEVTESPCTL